jgi:hypothetical protein
VYVQAAIEETESTINTLKAKFPHLAPDEVVAKISEDRCVRACACA